MKMEAFEPTRLLPFLSSEMELQLLGSSERMSFKKSSVLLKPGEHFDHVLFLLKGQVALHRTALSGRRYLMYRLNGACGCGLSMISALLQKSATITATVEEDADLLAIPTSLFMSFIRTNEAWSTYVMGVVHEQWLESLDMFDQFAFNSLEERLSNYFEDYRSSLGDIKDASRIKKSHADIASDLNVSREAVSRILKKMEREGLVILGHGSIEILKN